MKGYPANLVQGAYSRRGFGFLLGFGFGDFSKFGDTLLGIASSSSLRIGRVAFATLAFFEAAICMYNLHNPVSCPQMVLPNPFKCCPPPPPPPRCRLMRTCH